MEKDFGKVQKNDNTEIIVRVDDFGGKVGLTIREFTNDTRTGYKGFTKSGTRIPADKFLEFREIINSIPLDALKDVPATAAAPKAEKPANAKKVESSSVEDY